MQRTGAPCPDLMPALLQPSTCSAAANHLVCCLMPPNGWRYIMQTSKSMQQRLRQRSRQCPGRMAHDLSLYGHSQRFQVEILAAGLTNLQVEDKTKHYTGILKASGPTGYNDLPGCPGRSKLFQ